MTANARIWSPTKGASPSKFLHLIPGNIGVLEKGSRPPIPIAGGRKDGTDSGLGGVEAEAPGSGEYHVKVILEPQDIYKGWRWFSISRTDNPTTYQRAILALQVPGQGPKLHVSHSTCVVFDRTVLSKPRNII